MLIHHPIGIVISEMIKLLVEDPMQAFQVVVQAETIMTRVLVTSR